MVFLSNSICDLKILNISNYGIDIKQIFLLEELRQPPIYHLINNSVSYRPGNSEFGRLLMKISQITLNELTEIASCKQAYRFSFQNNILDEDTLAS